MFEKMIKGCIVAIIITTVLTVVSLMVGLAAINTVAGAAVMFVVGIMMMIDVILVTVTFLLINMNLLTNANEKDSSKRKGD